MLKLRGGFESWFVTCSMWVVVVMYEWKWMSIERRKYLRVFWLLCQLQEKLRSWWVIQIVWILFSIYHLHLRCRQSLNPDFGPRFGFKQAKTETDSSRACSPTLYSVYSWPCTGLIGVFTRIYWRIKVYDPGPCPELVAGVLVIKGCSSAYNWNQCLPVYLAAAADSRPLWQHCNIPADSIWMVTIFMYSKFIDVFVCIPSFLEYHINKYRYEMQKIT